MGSAYYVVLERKIEGLDTQMDGKSLARNSDVLDKAAKELGVKPFLEFFSMPPEEIAEFLGDTDDMKLPPLEQFPASEGLATVRALLAHPSIRDDRVIDDLKECERILSAAAEHGVGWHFQIDV